MRVVLRLQHESESPEGFVKTGCWATPPGVSDPVGLGGPRTWSSHSSWASLGGPHCSGWGLATQSALRTSSTGSPCQLKPLTLRLTPDSLNQNLHFNVQSPGDLITSYSLQKHWFKWEILHCQNIFCYLHFWLCKSGKLTSFTESEFPYGSVGTNTYFFGSKRIHWSNVCNMPNPVASSLVFLLKSPGDLVRPPCWALPPPHYSVSVGLGQGWGFVFPTSSQ